MKAAMWGVGIFVLGFLGIALVSLFGNITVTNQLNYTTMKNAVEAATYDALDIAHYRAGFCLCSNKEKENGKWTFGSDSEYKLLDITYNTYGDEECVSDMKTCERIYGEYRINPQIFSESLTRRFVEMVNNSKDYSIVIQDIIEYPPKVSVRVDSYDDQFVPTDKSSEGYSIVNQIDAIVETSGEVRVSVAEATPAPTATPEPTATPAPTPTLEPNVTPPPEPKSYCYYNNSKYLYCWSDENTVISTCGSGYAQTNVASNECINICYCRKDGKGCEIWAKKDWGSMYEIRRDSNGKIITNPDKCVSAVSAQTPNIPTATQPPNTGPAKKEDDGGCFLAGTKIVTINGYKDIEKIQIGDYVLTYNEEKQENEYKKVTYLFVFDDKDEELYTIKIDVFDSLVLTGHHSVYVYRDGKYDYITAEELKIGDIVMYKNKTPHIITNITHEPIKKTVYNFETEDNHNFYVGKKGVLVHNMYRYALIAYGSMGTNLDGRKK